MTESIDDYFTATISAMRETRPRRSGDDSVRDDSSLSVRDCVALFDAQLAWAALEKAAGAQLSP